MESEPQIHWIKINMCKLLQFRSLQPSSCHCLMSSPARPLTDVETLLYSCCWLLLVVLYMILLLQIVGRYDCLRSSTLKISKHGLFAIIQILKLRTPNYRIWMNLVGPRSFCPRNLCHRGLALQRRMRSFAFADISLPRCPGDAVFVTWNSHIAVSDIAKFGTVTWLHGHYISMIQ